MFNASDQGQPGKGPALDVGNIMQHTTKRNPGRSAGKGPALNTGDNMKFETNDEGTGVLADMPLGPHRFVFLPPVVDPSGSTASSIPQTQQNVESGSKFTPGESPGERNS